MRRLLARAVEATFEAYAHPTVVGPFVTAYVWALDVLHPFTPEMRADRERERRLFDLEQAAEVLEAMPERIICDRVSSATGGANTYRGFTLHALAADLRRVVADLDP